MNQPQEHFIDFHFFICTNARPDGNDCAGKGAEALQKELKAWSKTKEVSESLKGRKIRINKSGCLDRCKEGVACVAYPKGQWFLNVNVQDIELMKAKILASINPC